MKSERIEDLRKRYKKRWLLIAVDEVDPKTHLPRKGRVIARGRSRSEIHEAAKNYPELAYVTHSEDWPDDIAACFRWA